MKRKNVLLLLFILSIFALIFLMVRLQSIKDQKIVKQNREVQKEVDNIKIVKNESEKKKDFIEEIKRNSNNINKIIDVAVLL
jgi:hypothetical protein